MAYLALEYMVGFEVHAQDDGAENEYGPAFVDAEEVANVIKDFTPTADGASMELSVRRMHGVRWTMPGFIDCGEWELGTNEADAWETYFQANGLHGSRWTIEESDDSTDEAPSYTVHCYLPSDAAARAVVAHVQNLDGASLERDGEFVYCIVSDADAARDELENDSADVSGP